MVIILKTYSICPICKKKIVAEIVEENDKLVIIKKCDEHGTFKDIYWGDSKIDFSNYKIDLNDNDNDNCPFSCGLCYGHKSDSILVNIDVTNRCNLNCPICFANANKTKIVYEPDLDTIKKILDNLKKRGVRFIQFAGGEPTVRNDLFEIIKYAKDLGFLDIQLATNGIKLKDIDYLKKLKDVGLNTIYLQFDGISEKPYIIARGKNLFPIKDKIIKNCREINFNGVVLVPTLVKGVNDNEIGDIINYAVNNFDVVRGINFQPVSFVGRVEESIRLNGRITIPDFIKMVEEQTNGEILKEDFYPVTIESYIALFVEKLTNKERPKITCNPYCGVATYIFLDNDKIVPLPRFFNVDEFIEFLKENIDKIDGKLSKLKITGELLINIKKFIDFKYLPQSINIKELLNLIVGALKGDYSEVVKLHHKMILIGCMHFMDEYNFDIERVKRCCIHYALPDGKIIPFCSYNLIYRDIYEKKYSIPLDEWKNAKRD